MQVMVEKFSVHLMQFSSSEKPDFKNTVGYQKVIIQVISNGALSA
jgi:hypothetical protein